MKRKLHFSLRSVSVCEDRNGLAILAFFNVWTHTAGSTLEQLIMLIAIGITFTIAARIV